MRRLILLRHAKAERPPGEEDFDRPLAPQGATDAAIMGRVLADAGLSPDRVLVSAARRTRETWAELAQAFPNAEAEVRRDLYLADAHTLWNAVDEAAEGADTLLMVAHNPGIHALAAALLRRDGASPSDVARMERGFPTSTAAVFAVDEAGRASYDGLYLVAEHGGLGAE